MKSSNSAGSESSSKDLTVDGLTYQQKQRYYYLYPIYNNSELVIKLVQQIEGRGRNSWKFVNEKIAVVNGSDRESQRYFDALYDNFELSKVYSSAEIIGIVADVRRDLGLEPYINRLKKFCEEDFFNLFIVQDAFNETIVDGQILKSYAGYLPVFKFKPED